MASSVIGALPPPSAPDCGSENRFTDCLIHPIPTLPKQAGIIYRILSNTMWTLLISSNNISIPLNVELFLCFGPVHSCSCKNSCLLKLKYIYIFMTRWTLVSFSLLYTLGIDVPQLEVILSDHPCFERVQVGQSGFVC